MSGVETSDAVRLRALLTDARNAGPVHRIEFRDRIAARGEPAIDALVPWLEDPAMTAFTIRVIERIGHGGAPEAATKALRGARRRIDPRFLPDIEWAISQLRRASPPTPAAPASIRPSRSKRPSRRERPLGAASPIRTHGPLIKDEGPGAT